MIPWHLNVLLQVNPNAVYYATDALPRLAEIGVNWYSMFRGYRGRVKNEWFELFKNANVSVATLVAHIKASWKVLIENNLLFKDKHGNFSYAIAVHVLEMVPPNSMGECLKYIAGALCNRGLLLVRVKVCEKEDLDWPVE
jgi:hypothetical protein